ncbi:hypothetical protein I306_02730 [Cryptococcus gattii EJB2]|uniref:Uncharacterized protein n=1 Tax=Cryptococcus gattii EJB2 TaxID=1296103 RepID=A0ABR5BX43_9TREE|nr:hypothetical protein I306_02730 [Cryptococcus gattii EJB2]
MVKGIVVGTVKMAAMKNNSIVKFSPSIGRNLLNTPPILLHTATLMFDPTN